MSLTKSLLLTLFVLVGQPFLICAEEPQPALPSRTEAPSPTPAPSHTRPQLNIPEIPASVEPPTLVPPPPDSAPAIKVISKARSALPLSQLDAAFQQSPLAREAQEQRLHLEWRQLQNRTVGDPEVIAAKKAAATARTDLERRARMRDYYRILYAHMQALATAPDVKLYLEGQKNAAIAGLAQTRVRPQPTPSPRPRR